MKKRNRRTVTIGIVHILSTFNNTLITISDSYGTVIAWSSAGHNGFKGARKSTPYAAQVTSLNVSKKAMSLGMHTASIKIQGPGAGRDAAIRGLVSSGLNITSINDITSIPHNGCRSSKKRRV